MSYEPRGRVADLLTAMRAAPEKVVWPGADAAQTMGIAQANLTGYLDAVIKHKFLFRKIENGRSYFSLQPFPIETVSAPAPGPAAWQPPKMTPPRGQQASPPREPRPEPTRAPAPAPKPAPSPLPEPLPEPETPVEAAEEAPLFEACLWLDGDLVLYGMTELEDGGWLVKSEDVMRLRKRLAWMSA